MFFDSHCHLTAPAFSADLDDVLAGALDADVDHLVTIASTPDDAEACIELAGRRPWIHATAGLHPHEAASAEDDLRDRLRELLGRPQVVAVGECGLDFHYDNSPRAAQRRVFEAHVELAAETGLPLVVHSRDADDDTAAVLRDLPSGVSGVLHCFTGSDTLLETALEAGFHISFTGIVSFGGYAAAHQVRAVPADRLMIETDAPYLAPVPHRGRRNEPRMIAAVARAVAEHRGEPLEALAERTRRNALDFYRIEG